MAAIRPIDASARKWVERAAVAGPAYIAGVNNPRVGWASASAAAEGNWAAGVQAAVARKGFSGGIRKATDQKWKDGATSKGPGRFAEGVALASDAWTKGFGPSQAAIASLALPPRGPVGSPANLQRVSAVANALRALKTRAAGG